MKFFKSAFINISLTGLALILITSGCKIVKLNSADKEGYVRIFDGKTLRNWDGDSNYWKVENGNLVGTVTPATILKRNTFIIWRGGLTADFELKVDYRISEGGNSGINYRSEEIPDLPFALKGYQADIDGANRYTGQNYEERGRAFLALRGQKVVLESGKKPILESTIANSDSLKRYIKKDDWNEVHLIVKGNRMQHFINGVLMSEVTDNDTINRKFKGLLGVQVHVGPPMKIEYRNFRLKQ
ncbi:MAG: DUF1080 domain-containing protein [Lentimicrobiaceae bacterium]|nr:DUF1080 domain-containing protein [Lentimicrobiaceae bacterium]